MKNEKLILMTNHLGHKPGGGREHRLISTETLQTKVIVITDDCGEGSMNFRKWNDDSRTSWERLSSRPAAFKARFFAEMSKRLCRIPQQGAGYNEQFKDDMNAIEMMADRYPHLLRGCDLDSHAEVHDLRRYDRPEQHAEAKG